MYDDNQNAWSKEFCEEFLKVAKAVENLQKNEDFLTFRKFYIDKQRDSFNKDMRTGQIPVRQLAIESLIGISNLEHFLDSKIPDDKEKAEMYLAEYKKSPTKE